MPEKCQTHGVRKSDCLACCRAGVPGCGTRFCQTHGVRKSECLACRRAGVPGRGTRFCAHGQRPGRCKACHEAGVPGAGSDLCEHGVYKATCPICWELGVPGCGLAICDAHGVRKSRCKRCLVEGVSESQGVRKREDLATVRRAPDVCRSQAQQLNVVAAARGEGVDDLGEQRPRSRSRSERSVRSKSPPRPRIFWQPQVEVLLTCGHTRWQARRCRLSRKTRPVPGPCGVYYQNASTASGRGREVAVCVQCGWQPRAPQSQALTDGQALMLELGGVRREARPGDDDDDEEFGESRCASHGQQCDVLQGLESPNDSNDDRHRDRSRSVRSKSPPLSSDDRHRDRSPRSVRSPSPLSPV